MASIAAKERLTRYALAAAYVGAYLFAKRLTIQRSLADPDWLLRCCFDQPPPPASDDRRRRAADKARVWNKSVDLTLGRLVVHLSSRGW